MTWDVNEEFRWGLRAVIWQRRVQGYSEKKWGGGGIIWAVLSTEAGISGQIDHVATSEFLCQSALNTNDSAEKQTGMNQAAANSEPVLVVPQTNPPHLCLSSLNLNKGSEHILITAFIWAPPIEMCLSSCAGGLATAKTRPWHVQLNIYRYVCTLKVKGWHVGVIWLLWHTRTKFSD